MTHSAKMLPIICAACGFLLGCSHPYVPPPDPTLRAEAFLPLQAGNDAANRGDWNTAIAQFEQARKLSPRSHLPLYGLATAYDNQGGRDAIALAYFRAYLVSLPAGQSKELTLVLGRADELDKQFARRISRLSSQARQMLEAIPPDIWWNPTQDRAKLLALLDDADRKANQPPSPPDAHRDYRGQPSELARLEAESWVNLAEQFKSSPALAEPGKVLRSGAPAEPELVAANTCSLVSRQAEALTQLRDLERQWQAKFGLIYSH